MTKEDVIVKIDTVEYPTRTHYSVTSKYGAHTFINQADSLAEAESIAENHRAQLVQLYTPVELAPKKEKKTVDSSKASDFSVEA